MAGVRAFTYSSGTISEKWDDSEPEIKVVELVFQGKVFPYRLPSHQRGYGSLVFHTSGQDHEEISEGECDY